MIARGRRHAIEKMSKKFTPEEVEIFSDLIVNAFPGSEADKIGDAVRESVFKSVEEYTMKNYYSIRDANRRDEQRERDEANIKHFMDTGFPNVSMVHKAHAFKLAEQVKAINWSAQERPRYFYSGLYNRLKFIVDPLA